MAACCWGRGVPDERSWAASWVEAIKQGGEFLEDDLIWPACSPTLPLSLVLRGSATLKTRDRVSSGPRVSLWTLFEACDSKFSLPFALGL